MVRLKVSFLPSTVLTCVCLLLVVFRMAPTMEWDTAAADIIVKEAGGVVLQAGKVTGKGELLEDWRVRHKLQLMHWIMRVDNKRALVQLVY